MIARRAMLFLAVLALFPPVWAGAADVVSTGELLASPDKWHGQPVALEGTVTRLDSRVSQRGNPYFTFQLVDRAGFLPVFGYGAARVTEGARVRVEGTFLKIKRVGKHTFQNQVDATRIQPL